MTSSNSYKSGNKNRFGALWLVRVENFINNESNLKPRITKYLFFPACRDITCSDSMLSMSCSENNKHIPVNNVKVSNKNKNKKTDKSSQYKTCALRKTIREQKKKKRKKEKKEQANRDSIVSSFIIREELIWIHLIGFISKSKYSKNTTALTASGLSRSIKTRSKRDRRALPILKTEF